MLSFKILTSVSAIGLALAVAPAFADTVVGSNSGAVSAVSVVTPVAATPSVAATASQTERPRDATSERRHEASRHERRERLAAHREHHHHGHHQIVAAHDARPAPHHYRPVMITTAAGGGTMVGPRPESHPESHPAAALAIGHVTHVPPARVALAPVTGK